MKKVIFFLSRHDLPPGSPHYSIGSNGNVCSTRPESSDKHLTSAGLSSSPPGPHSPHSLSPDTPPPAYSPRLLAFTRVRKGSMNYCGRDIDTDRPPPESNNGMETDNNSAEAVPYQVSIFTFPFYAPFSFPQLTFLFHFAFANIVSNFYTRNPSTGRPSPIMS